MRAYGAYPLSEGIFCFMNDEQEKVIKKQNFLEYYKQLPVLKLAAASVGKSDDTIRRWRDEDAVFAAQIDFLKAQWALEKSKTIKSTEWLLERVLREEFYPPKREEILNEDNEFRLPTIIIDRPLPQPQPHIGGLA